MLHTAVSPAARRGTECSIDVWEGRYLLSQTEQLNQSWWSMHRWQNWSKVTVTFSWFTAYHHWRNFSSAIWTDIPPSCALASSLETPLILTSNNIPPSDWKMLAVTLIGMSVAPEGQSCVLVSLRYSFSLHWTQSYRECFHLPMQGYIYEREPFY